MQLFGSLAQLESMNNNLTYQIEEVEEEIKCLRDDLFQSIPFKRSQAHVWGEDQEWIDRLEVQIKEKLMHKEDVLQGYLSLCN